MPPETKELCIEISSGENFSGSISLEENKLELKLFGFNRECYVGNEKPISVRTENNKYVTIYDSFSSTGRKYGPSADYVSECLVHFNRANYGADLWLDSDKVKTVRFSVKGSEKLVEDSNKIDRIHASAIPDYGDIQIYVLPVGKLTIGANYSVVSKLGGLERHTISPEFTIEFHDPVSSGEEMKYVYEYVSFLSFFAFKKLEATNIRISRYYVSEFTDALKSNPNSVWEHRVCTLSSPSSDKEIATHNLHIEPISIFGDAEKLHFLDCLKRWFSIENPWKDALRFFYASIGFRNIHASERLLTAYKWLDSIPSSKHTPSPNQNLDEIVNAAIAMAEQQGTTEDFKNRIKGALSKLNAETHKERFLRIIVQVNLKFKDVLVKDRALERYEFRRLHPALMK